MMEKNIKLRFDSFKILLPIIIYLFVITIASYISNVIGIPYLINAIVEILFVVISVLILKRKKLILKYGLCVINPINYKKLLYFIPLVIMPILNLIFGVYMNYSIQEIVLIIITMIGASFMEEILFRSHLVRNYEPFGKGYAIVLSSMIFSMFHLLNLTSSANVLLTIIQLLSAFFIGLLFSSILIKTNTVIPCFICHSMINVSNIFMNQKISSINMLIIYSINILISLAYTIYIHSNYN